MGTNGVQAGLRTVAPSHQETGELQCVLHHLRPKLLQCCLATQGNVADPLAWLDIRLHVCKAKQARRKIWW